MLQSFSSDPAFRGLSRTPFSGSSPCTLGKRTVIYGRNGAGKTSLSEALRLAEEFGTADKAALKARVVLNGAASTVDIAPGSLPFRLFVYNRFFVQDSLRLFLEGDGHAVPILRLGTHNVQAEQELLELRDGHDALEQRKAAIQGASKVLTQDRETLEQQTKASIIAALGASDAAYYNQTRFQIPQVRKLLSNESADLLETEKLSAELAAATTSTLEPLSLASRPKSVSPSMHATINVELLSVTVDAVPIPRLAVDLTLSDWVEHGLPLHHAGDLCGFCQVGTVTKELLISYRQHFSKALEALRERMIETITDLEARRDSLDAWALGLPKETDFLPDWRERARTELRAVADSVQKLSAALTSAVDAIKRRVADPLKPRPESESLQPFPLVDDAPLSTVVADNNVACESQADRIAQAKRAVEEHHGASHGADYRKLIQRLKLVERATSTIDHRIRTIAARRLVVEQSLQDVGQMANLIDADLGEHFGYAHLQVSVSADGKGYVVYRSGQMATHLSEGERNAIAFTYFLRSLEEDGVDPASSVVLIDDPVTSLDKESLFAAYALASTRTEAFAQTIVFTHDYEYFRLHLIDLKNQWDKSQKRIRENNMAEKLMPKVSFLEVRAVLEVTLGLRHSEIRELPRSLIQHPSEYHFLFLHVAEAVNGSSQEFLPLAGNAGRRLLEGFLSFRAPHGINFQAKVDAVANAASIDPALSKRVVKFLHSQSHREEPRPSSALDFPSVEAELVTAMRFINEADEPHFAAMCTAVGMNPIQVLGHLQDHPAS